MSFILPGLYICNASDVENHQLLKAIRATHVINCAAGLNTVSYDFLKGTHKLDFEDEDDSSYLEKAHACLFKGAYKLQEFYGPGNTVVVHCMAGISRSPSVVIAWLIIYKGMTYEEAFALVIRNRPFIRPNVLFTRILKALRQEKVKGRSS